MPGLPDTLLKRAGFFRDILTLLVIALLPFQTRFIRSFGYIGDAPWEAATRGLYVTEILLLLALILHLFSVASGRRKKMVSPTWLQFWILLLLYALASILWSPSPNAAATTWTHLFEGFALMYLIWISDRPLHHFVYALVCGGVVNASFAVWQFLAQSSFASSLLGIAIHPAAEPGISVIETSTGRFLRAYGLSPHPNLLGGHLAASLLGATWLYVGGAKKWARPALLGAIVLMLLGLCFSFSRSAWLGYGTVLLIGLVYRYARLQKETQQRILKLVTLHVVVGLFFVIIAGPLIATRLGIGSRLERMSIDQRSVAAYRSMELIRRYHATGVGIGNMPLAAYEHLRPRGDDYGYEPAHHVGLLVATELGFFGFMMLLGAVVTWLSEAKKVFRFAATPFLRGIALFPLLFIIIGFFDHYPFSLYGGTMLVGIAFGVYAKAELS